MFDKLQRQFKDELQTIRDEGLFKSERIIDSTQGVEIVVGGQKVLNFCANNYLGLASDPQVISAAKNALDRWGYGLASVRFICGTQQVHKDLERAISTFLNTDDTILYSSCFDANGGLFETITDESDAIISDRLNHASIIDGIRLSKAKRFVYDHLDLHDLEKQLREAASCRRKIVVTDGVFSMDGDIAPLAEIAALTDKYAALLVVDDSHATGFVGPHGRGTPEHHNIQSRVDLITGTLGKALGGAAGGFTSGHQEIIDYLRQRSRPYLFSNSLPPFIVASSLSIIEKLTIDESARNRLWDNTRYFRQGLAKVGLSVHPGVHPIIPVILNEANLSQRMAARLLELGIYVISFSFPVVPKDSARIRVQISAAHTTTQLDRALDAFAQVAKENNLV